jgi:hypothetical protein
LVVIPPPQKNKPVVFVSPAAATAPAATPAPVAPIATPVPVPAPAIAPKVGKPAVVASSQKVESTAPSALIQAKLPATPAPVIKTTSVEVAPTPAPSVTKTPKPAVVVPTALKSKQVAPTTPIQAPASVKPEAEAKLEVEAKLVVPAKTIVPKKLVDPAKFPLTPKAKHPFPGAALPAKRASRRTPDDMTRLYINVGEEMGVTSQDVVSTILGETGSPPEVVGVVDIRERHLFVDVAADSAAGIIAKLNRAKLKNLKIKVKLA